MKSSCPRPVAGRRSAAPAFLGAIGVLLALAHAAFVSPARAETPAPEPPSLSATLDRPDAAGQGDPGRVILEIVPSLPEDPAGSVRLQAVLVGPLTGERADDIYAFSAGLGFPADKMEYVPSSLRKGDLLERDGRSSLITGGVTPSELSRLTVGGSRLGAVPGISAPKGRSTLFSVAFGLLAPGKAELEWHDASLIDSSVKPVDAARFVSAVLTVAERS